MRQSRTDTKPASGFMPGTIVIGIGNWHRRDDAVGLHVARRLTERLPEAIQVFVCRGETTELLLHWEGAQKAVIVDAMDCGQSPGHVIRLDAARDTIPASLHQTSSHGLGLAQAVELARTLGTLPAQLIVFGIQGADYRMGDELSPAVANAVDACCLKVLDELTPDTSVAEEPTRRAPRSKRFKQTN